MAKIRRILLDAKFIIQIYFSWKCFLFFFSTWLEKKQKNQGCQKISSKLRFCFFPETETHHFRKIEFLYCVFLAQVLQHKTEPCFVSKFSEGHSFLRFKKIFLIHNANFEFLRAFIEYLEFSAVLLWTLETCQAAGWLCILYLPRQARYNALNMHETL